MVSTMIAIVEMARRCRGLLFSCIGFAKQILKPTTLALCAASILLCKSLWILSHLDTVDATIRTILIRAMICCFIIHVLAGLFYAPFRICQHCFKIGLYGAECCDMRRAVLTASNNITIADKIRKIYRSVRDGIVINEGYGIFHHPLFPRVCDSRNCTHIRPPDSSSFQEELFFYEKEDVIKTEYNHIVEQSKEKDLIDKMQEYAIVCEKLDDLYSQFASPPRTRHCENCNRCRAALSHHCAFVQTCIHEETYPPYIAYLVTSFVSMTFTSIGLSCDLIYHNMYSLPTFPITIIKILCTLMAIGLNSFLAAILFPHIVCLYDNIEFGTRAKYDYILDSDDSKTHSNRKVPSPWDFKPKYGPLIGLYLNLRYRVWDGVGPMSVCLQYPRSSVDTTDTSKSSHDLTLKILLDIAVEVLDTVACFVIPIYFASKRRKSRFGLSSDDSLIRTHAKGLHFPDLKKWSQETHIEWSDAFMNSMKMDQSLDMRTSRRNQ